MSRMAQDVFREAYKEESHIPVTKKRTVLTTEFDFEPVPLRTFLAEKQYLGLPALSPKQLDAVEVCTQVYFPKTLEELHWHKRKYIKEAVFLWGKGAGKDFCARIILLRIAYLLMALKSPQMYYSFASDAERIDMLNTATNDTQAVNVFFAPLRIYATKSPFFKNRVKVLTHEIEFEKNIHLFSGHSEADPMEGMSLIAVILDEIAAFKTDEEVAELKRSRARKTIPRSAESLYEFARTSVDTRFPQVGKVIMISFPRFKGDYITTKYDEGKNNPMIYTSFGSTFEVNPTKKKSDFEDLRKTKPELYNCRILCQPGVAEDAFFKNTPIIEASFRRDLFNPVDYDIGKFKPNFVCRDNFLRYGHVDLAKNRCWAAFSFVHSYAVESAKFLSGEDVTERRVIIVEKPKIRVDVIRYFSAPFGGEIDFKNIENAILEMEELRGFQFGLITFDGYNSIQMRQTLEDYGITVDEQSVDRTRDAYEAFQDVLYEGRLECYYERYLVEEELPFLVDVKGRKIDHRKGRSKDGADSLAGAIKNCIDADDWGEASVWSG